MKSIQRCMVFVAGAVAAWGGPSAAPARARESRAEAELRYQALNVFQRHCLKCHGDAAQVGVRIPDRTLLVEQRQVVRPGSAQTSELFDLVQGGSMPPGNHPKVPDQEITLLQNWIDAGAPPLPSEREESYVLWSIVRDLRTLTDEQKRSARYLSLNHLLARENAVGGLDRQRKALHAVLGHLVPEGKKPPDVRAVEPTGTVFRIDLRDLGWDQPAYPKAAGPWDRLNLFDLALLEYPHGWLPTGSPFYDEDLLPFLRAAGQVRPIPYVRADWLAEAIVRPPLYPDFLKVLGKPPDSKPAGVGDPLRALEFPAPRHGEGGWAEELFVRQGLFVASLPRRLLADQGKEQGALRELSGGLLDRDRPSGLAIVPLDGLTYPKHNSDIEFRAIDFRQRGQADPPAKDPFAPGDRMALWFRAGKNAVVELAYTDNTGRKSLLGGLKSLQAGNAETFPPGGIGKTLDEKAREETEEFTVYAYPAGVLDAGHSPFPRGAALHADGIHDRIVHPLYKLRPDGKGFEQPDPGKMIKVTIRITTSRPGKD